jgi:hypothetical protein
MKSSFVRLWHHGAGEMCAFLAEGNEGFFARSQQQTTVVRLGIGKGHCSANGDLIDGGNLPQRKLTLALTQIILGDDPELAGGECQTGQDHEYREVTTRDVVVLGPIYGKVLTPLRLIFQQSPIRGSRQVFELTLNH